MVNTSDYHKACTYLKNRYWIFSPLFYFVSYCFQWGVAIRNWLFDRKIFTSYSSKLPVVSVGNIIAGGAGKTAFIQKLAQDLTAHAKVSILLRGYRSQIEKTGGSYHVKGYSQDLYPICGDEACVLFQSLSNVNIFVGKNRCLNVQRAAYHNTEIVLLDDGMQHRWLSRDLDLVVLHAGNLYGGHAFLPRGYLRDSPKRLKDMDYIIINHIRDIDHFNQISESLKKDFKAPVIGVQMVPDCVECNNGDVLYDLKELKVGVFCGLGMPSSFIDTVRVMGGSVCDQWLLPDHIAPTLSELESFASRCNEKNCDLLVCSHKDWVKLPHKIECSTLPIGVLKAKMDIVAGHKEYQLLLKDIEHLKKDISNEAVD